MKTLNNLSRGIHNLFLLTALRFGNIMIQLFWLVRDVIGFTDWKRFTAPSETVIQSMTDHGLEVLSMRNDFIKKHWK